MKIELPSRDLEHCYSWGMECPYLKIFKSKQTNKNRSKLSGEMYAEASEVLTALRKYQDNARGTPAASYLNLEMRKSAASSPPALPWRRGRTEHEPVGKQSEQNGRSALSLISFLFASCCLGSSPQMDPNSVTHDNTGLGLCGGIQSFFYSMLKNSKEWSPF